MFPLTRPYRQAAATVALVVLTVAPTVYVAPTAWKISRPGHRHEVEAEIGRLLGLQVTLDAVRYPRPGEVVYRGVVLRQEEPRRKGLTEVARADVGPAPPGRPRADPGGRGPAAPGREPAGGDGAGRRAAPAVGRAGRTSGSACRPRPATSTSARGSPPYRLREVVGAASWPTPRRRPCGPATGSSPTGRRAPAAS